jgi:hypothetical protein
MLWISFMKRIKYWRWLLESVLFVEASFILCDIILHNKHNHLLQIWIPFILQCAQIRHLECSSQFVEHLHIYVQIASFPLLVLVTLIIFSLIICFLLHKSKSHWGSWGIALEDFPGCLGFIQITVHHCTDDTSINEIRQKPVLLLLLFPVNFYLVKFIYRVRIFLTDI